MVSSNKGKQFYGFLTNKTTPKHISVLCNLIQEFKNRFQYLCILVGLFSVSINMLPANFQVEHREPQSDIQPKEKFNCVILPNFCRSHLVGNEYTLTFRPHSCHHFLAAPTYVSNYNKERSTLNKIRHKISGEHPENSLRIETTSIEPDNDAFVPQIPHLILCCPFYFTFITENTKNINEIL